MIGIVSSPDDLHADSVRLHLDSAGADYVVIDTSTFPQQVALTTTEDPTTGWAADWSVVGSPGDGTDADASETWDLRDVHAMWWRRPQPFELDPGISDAHDRVFARGECAAMVAGLWHCLDAEWVNDPDRDEAGSRKMHQLRLATELGLRVPRTCMTNSPERARAFIAAEPGPVIFKSFSATPVTWRETRVVREHDLELIDMVRLAPVIFQEAIPGGVDIRVTIVGDTVFPAEIRAGDSAYEFDFRVEGARSTIEPHRLPTGVTDALLRMMQHLGLRYGAIDLRRAPDGDYVFLEINPAGQWLFVEVKTGQPIAATLAHLLHDLDRGEGSRPRVMARRRADQAR